jgi:DNA-binding CsgD family transcriptional regulator
MPAEAFVDALLTPGTQLRTRLGTAQQGIDCRDQGIDIFYRHNHAGVAHHFRQGAAIGGDHRYSASHGLPRWQAEALIHRGNHRDSCLRVIADHLLRGDAADKLYLVGNTETAHQLFRLAPRLWLANQQQFQLRILLEQVFSAHRNSEPGFVKAFRVGQVDSLTGLGLLIRPLPIVDSSAAQQNPSVAIFIGDQEQRRVAPDAVLAELFGFTPAESSLALLLSNGLTLDEASDELGVTRNTAKSHLSSVFSKTGLTRQTKLVQLILKSVASFGA